MSLVTINIHSCNGAPPHVEAPPSITDELRRLGEKIDRLVDDESAWAMPFINECHAILDSAGIPDGNTPHRLRALVAQRDAAVADREALLGVCRPCLGLWETGHSIDENDTEAILVRQAVSRVTKTKGV